MKDYDIQKSVFENSKRPDNENQEAYLYEVLGKSLSEDVEVGLSVDFADRVVAKAMTKPLWQKVLNTFLWTFGLSATFGLGVYGFLFIVEYAVPNLSLDLKSVLAWKWHVLFIVVLLFAVEMADAILVKKDFKKNIRVLFD